MTKPVTIPNAFAGASSATTAQLDADFTAVANAINDPNTYANYATDTGAANAYVVDPTPAFSTLTKGLSVVTFQAANSNTGGSTINVSGLGALSLLRPDGSALQSGDIAANAFYQAAYDGSAFRLMNYGPGSGTYIAGAALYGAAGARHNLVISAMGATNYTATVTADWLLLRSASGTVLSASNVNVSLAINTSGANGLDTGSLAASTWYYVYIISTGAVFAALASLSATAPTLPSGYTYYARVGAVWTDSSANAYLMQTKQKDNQGRFILTAGTNVASLPTLASGTAGSAPSFVPISVNGRIPGTASMIRVTLTGTYAGTGAGVGPNGAYQGISGATMAPLFVSQGASQATYMCVTGDILLESTNIYWYAAGSSYLLLEGWTDNL